jgi:hypothetical protein
MSHLRDLTFCNNSGSSSLHEVAEAISLPQINRLEIRVRGVLPRNEDISWTQQCSALDALAGTSSVKDLTLEGWIDSVVLGSSLWKVPHALEKLTCLFYGAGSLTAEETINALRPLYSTLVSLDISYIDFLRQDLTGPVADFSFFVCLKTLNVDDSLCFER